MSIKRKPPKKVDVAKAEAIIEAGEGTPSVSLNKEKKSLFVPRTQKKEKLSSVNLQISESIHNTLKTFAAKKNLKLYEVYNFMAQHFIDDLSRFDDLVFQKKSEVTLFNFSDGWKIDCPICGKESVIKDPDGTKFIKFKKDLKVVCPKCSSSLHISGIEM
jgi:DNA-directed RNA polymerase subunit RPC12/RpoP